MDTKNMQAVSFSDRGLWIREPINENSVKALAKIGINDIDYTSKRLSFYMVDVLSYQQYNPLLYQTYHQKDR